MAVRKKTGESDAIVDVGEKIGGARKDWRSRVMELSDLESMTPVELVTIVRKDRIWPQPDFGALVASGLDPTVAALIKISRDTMAATPRVMRGADPLQASRDYVAMVTAARDAFDACTTIVAVRTVEKRLSASVIELKANPIAYKAAQLRYWSVFKSRSSPFSLNLNDVRRAELMVAEGFPGKIPAWRKGFTTTVIGERAFLIKNRQVYGSGFADETSAWAWLEAQAVTAPVARGQPSSRQAEPTRPHLDNLCRSGVDHRMGGDVNAADFMDSFGFRGVEFGNWLPDNERQQVLNLAFDAFHDLAAAVGIDPMAVSLNGTLAIAFGSRGTGKAAAHYEPQRAVINMTRLRGAGTLAHEWAHAWDHFLGVYGGGELEAGAARFASGGQRFKKSRTDALSELPQPLPGLFENVMHDFLLTQCSRDEAINRANLLLDRTHTKISREERTIATSRLALNGPYERKVVNIATEAADYFRAVIPQIEAKIERLRDGDPSEILEAIQSKYMAEAIKLDDNGSRHYYTNPVEVFARAFECLVFDRITQHGLRSDYLVHSVDADLYESQDYRGNPYPVGKERTAYSQSLLEIVEASSPLLTSVPSLALSR